MDLNTLPKWEYEIPTGGAVNDETERPPLTGKAVYVPKGLYEQPWSEVHDAYGAATLTPYYIEALASPDVGDQQFGSYGLYAATTHQGSVYEASKMAIPFLVDMLNAEKDHGFIIASHFISRIAVGEKHFIRTPKDIEASKSIYFNDVFAYLDQLITFYKRTNSEEVERLLCFYPNILPDYLDLNIDNAERLASALVTQGFIAAERGCKEHKSTVQELMYNSPSLLVRGAAAICLSYSNMVNDDVSQLLEYIAAQNFRYTPWVWDNLNDMASSAWLYAADMETLLSRKPHVQDYEPLSKLKCLDEAFSRVFKPRNYPYLPTDLSPIQKRVLEEFADYNPNSLHRFEFDGYNVPENLPALKRLLGRSEDLLCKNISIEYDNLSGYPLWYLLES